MTSIGDLSFLGFPQEDALQIVSQLRRNLTRNLMNQPLKSDLTLQDALEDLVGCRWVLQGRWRENEPFIYC